ncbi:MAG: hypothetical protein V2A34_05675, partial [Lentisphaerota bacterium]
MTNRIRSTITNTSLRRVLVLSAIPATQPDVGVSEFDARATLTLSPPGDGLHPWLHVNALLTPPWEQALVVLPNAEKSRLPPILLGMGIAPERILHLPKEALQPPNSSSKLAKFMNQHTGRRAFIIGNGPSLKIADLDRLHDEITFASNKIYLAYDQADWRPTYYTVCDYLVAQNNADRINALVETKIFPSSLQQHGCGGTHVITYEERFENKCFDQAREMERAQADFLFSRDARFGVQGGYTVIYHQLQLAFFMGIREVYLIGLDFHFHVPKNVVEDPRFTSDVYRKALSSTGECNHFHPDYRKPGENWSVPRMDL